jgi:hypothetical protein
MEYEREGDMNGWPNLVKEEERLFIVQGRKLAIWEKFLWPKSAVSSLVPTPTLDGPSYKLMNQNARRNWY